ncbi:Putative auto-transporter adhesin, head GIN domain [Saccharicrinis carchari]|uniref:Auto-transporter adhesin, head GIN domain n=1 Tax=Saccharicrinis carchari TaxID=1168039 RepID=A0A521FBV6_SACCC|nr:head GIN domain-containing protein [Saccharicrinis carchari]SMO93081.1 Putative auto-transporter adhesin, head GIN domain [Saccharicrinis carchari]
MTIKKLVFASIAVLIGLLIFVQISSAQREIRQVGNFNSIKVANGLDVYITQQNERGVEIEASKGQIHRIITEVKGETLHVYVKGSFKWNLKDTRKVYISSPIFKNITANGGADIHGTTAIKAENLNLECNGGADIYLSVYTNNLNLNCTGGADMLIEGTTEKLTASASGGADINAKKLKAKHATVSASGGGDVEVFASESLTANASGGGDVNYSGSPKMKQINESGGGDVSGY